MANREQPPNIDAYQYIPVPRRMMPDGTLAESLADWLLRVLEYRAMAEPLPEMARR